MPKLLLDSEFNLKKQQLEQGLECVESCNYNHCLTTHTQLVIVGTITPPEGAGYFYTAPRNKIYGYIDQSLGDTNLKQKKQNLLQNPNNKEIIEDIKQTLISKKIAFLDVIKYAIRKNNSPYDNDIKYYTLDTESFKQAPNAKYICNSRFAMDCFTQICKQLNLNLDYVYLSQRSATKTSWLEQIKKSLK